MDRLNTSDTDQWESLHFSPNDKDAIHMSYVHKMLFGAII